jgi:DNA replication protein DnaC
MQIQTIQEQLRQLRMPAAAAGLENVLANQKKAVSLDWMSHLLSIEVDARREKMVQSRIKAAHFPEQKTIEGFDFGFNPQISESGVKELATLDFIQRNGIVLLLGQTGTGKTHVALSLGIMAARSGYRVYCTSAKILHAAIRQAIRKDTLDQLFKKILTSKLWIIDDWGVVTYPKDIAEEVFDLFDRRKHNSAMILTSNRDVQEWPHAFPDLVLANATIDRMFENSTSIVFMGDSYRLKGRIEITEKSLNTD